MVYDFKKLEKKVLAYWKRNRVYERLKKRNAEGPKFFHLDGPPYATGNPHPGTAINRGLKDLVRRFKRMKGMNVWDQPGFDMHGLPIESMVEKKLGLKNKKEVVAYGVSKFMKQCKKYSFQYLDVMGRIFQRLGEWATWDQPYETTNNDYIEGVWWALKEIYKKDALYEGSRVLYWCPHCGTALASNYEIGYETLTEKSIYVKFKVKDGLYLVIWTTTPWTLSSNMAVMINPDIDYAYVKTGDETWIIAKELVNKVMNLTGRGFEILRTVKGKSLKDLEYEHVFKNEVPYHSTHQPRVVLSRKYVNLEAGTGLVHCAPGCGPEDHEVGLENGIEAFNPIDEHGVMGPEAGQLKGLRAKTDDAKFIDLLYKKGNLVAEELITHDYPHCERCKSPVVFKNTDQWFIKVTDFKDKMIKENKSVNWVPSWAGERQFNNWLEGVKDWCITRQRFWGIPLPVWKCDKCAKVKVVASAKELPSPLKDLHKPYIDKVKWKCKCGGTYIRNPDVIDVWIDSACAPFASLPRPRDEWMKKLGKIDFITESIDQIRGWFYSLMGIGVGARGECPYTNVFMHGYLCDASGAKLSKRKGNYMSMEETFDKVGADVFRTSLMSNLTPGVDSKFIMDEVSNVYKSLNVVWNTHEFIKRNLKHYKVKSKLVNLRQEDEWLLSRLNSLIKNCNEVMTNYHLEQYAPSVLQFLVDDLSRFYIKLIRPRLASDAQTVLSVLHYCYIEALKLLGPVAPFIAEEIYQQLGAKDSLFFELIPDADQSLIKPGLESDFELLSKAITATLAAREKAGLNLRWPVQRVWAKVPKRLIQLYLEFINAKELMTGLPPGLKLSFKPDYNSIKDGFNEVLAGKIIPQLLNKSEQSINENLSSKGFLVLVIDGTETILTQANFTKTETLPDGLVAHEGVYLSIELSNELLSEGYARELGRRIQEARKELKLKKRDRIIVSLKAPKKFQELVKPHLSELMKTTGSSIDFKPSGNYDLSKSHELRDFNVIVKIRH